jgi:predicted  nucleic acid-binding Zn-ribbon protein
MAITRLVHCFCNCKCGHVFKRQGNKKLYTCPVCGVKASISNITFEKYMQLLREARNETTSNRSR